MKATSRQTAVRVLLAATFVLTGCSALIGTKDIFLDDTSGSGDGGNLSETSTPDGFGGQDDAPDNTDGGTCTDDVLTSKTSCGRCNHDCLGGDCVDGKCQALQLASVSGAPFFNVATSANSVFFSTVTQLTTETGGIWRIAKTSTGGTAPDAYVVFHDAESMVVVGETLFFVVDGQPAGGGADQFGGLYSCPAAGASPCTPKLIAPATSSRAMTVDNGKIYFDDGNKGLSVYDPATPLVAPKVFRADLSGSYNYLVEGTSAWFTFTFQPANPPQVGELLVEYPDAGRDIAYSYTSNQANAGVLQGYGKYFLFTGYDFEKTTGGVVHRFPRDGGPSACDFGGTGNKRPYGVAADGTRVYWANQGIGVTEPYTGGSVATCTLATCCTTPDVMWTGDGQPTALTVDDTAVYWVTKSSSALWKIAKP